VSIDLARRDLDFLGIGLVRLDRDLRIRALNDQAVFLLSSDHSDALLSRKIYELEQIHSQNLETVLREVADRGGSHRVHAGIRQPTGKIVHTRVTAYSATEDGDRNVVSVLIQVVDQEVKQESEAYWKSILLDQIGDYVYAKDADGRLIYANMGFRTAYVPTDDPIPHPDRTTVIPTRQAVYERALAEVVGEGGWSGYLRRMGPDGSVTVLRCEWARVESKYYHEGIVLCHERDVSIEAQREASRIEQARLDDVGLMMSGMVHDLNNVLGPATLASDMLTDKYSEDEMVGIVADGLRSAKDINANIRNYLDGIELTPKRVNVGEIVWKVHDALDQILTDGVALRIDLASEPLHCHLVDIYLKRVLFNLLGNANDAVGGSGWIKITLALSCYEEEGDDPYVQLVAPPDPEGECIAIEVSDSGPGIPVEDAVHITEAYFTTKEAGSGLGLSVCADLVKKMGGALLLKPSGAPGAAFRALLPCA
jgi:signal transduction histidine kinase